MPGVRSVDSEVLLSPDFAVAKDTHRIQFRSALSDPAIKSLARTLRARPDLELRVYGRDGSIRDLTFLRALPQVQTLHIELDGLVSLAGIEATADSLKSLVLGATKVALDLSPINDLPSIVRMYVEKHHRVVDLLAAWPTLRSLTLRSSRIRSIAPILNAPGLEALDLKLGALSSLQGIGSLESLVYVELWGVRNLDSIEGLAEVPRLQELYLDGLPRVEEVRALVDQQNLDRLTLRRMTGLSSFDDVIRIPNLHTVIVEEMPHIGLEEYAKLSQAPSLREVELAPVVLSRLRAKGVEPMLPGVADLGRHPALRSSLSRQ